MLILLIEFISFMDEKMCLALNKKPGKFYYCTQKYIFIIFLFHGPTLLSFDQQFWLSVVKCSK